ncbi:hypothetical protein AU210_014984 [Fusarium oxysporum f. sp. radicis-cucumerinum]|uniref:cutinase n=1 Tax=Fusarium oxysporum f. sp. radicis-cucumerinum TaxID=327505 RepID=A0A2H3G8T2_FUSOX|nr:hypothetical protein AU210_014984 [Fusarium oxysporum f. sp. radicis-cucumerinum]
MKPTQALIALAAIVYAAPVVEQTKTLTPPLAELDTHFEHHNKRCGKEEPPFLGRFPFANETYNQLTDGTPCRNVTMIYARGSRQAGNVGKANNTGPALFNSLADRIGLENLAVQGVTYKARRRDFIFKGGCNEGSKTMAKLINQAASQCPDTKIVIAGYSQGAQLLHKAAKNVTAGVTQHIAAAVTLGYPKKPMGKIAASRSLSVCRPGDSFCDKTIPWKPFVPIVGAPLWWFITMLDTHGDYNENATVVANWIADRVTNIG